jgi:hypothetical protein
VVFWEKQYGPSRSRVLTMRERVVPVGQLAQPDGDWLNLGSLAQVEISSEDPEHPIESALISGN